MTFIPSTTYIPQAHGTLRFFTLLSSAKEIAPVGHYSASSQANRNIRESEDEKYVCFPKEIKQNEEPFCFRVAVTIPRRSLVTHHLRINVVNGLSCGRDSLLALDMFFPIIPFKQK